MFETTPRDLIRWQRRAHQALQVFLEHAYREGMPALTWTINTTGGLIGDVHLLGATPAEQRAAFDAWVDYLGGKRWQEQTRSTGTVHLHAEFAWRRNDRGKGAIRCDIFPDDEAGER